MKSAPIIFIMFAVILLSLGIIYAVSTLYGSDWNWIATELVAFLFIFLLFGVTIFTLKGWL